MEPRNQTAMSTFLLLGLSEDAALQPLLFGLFLSTDVVCVLGNLLIVLAITFDAHLHTPMYFFLSNLSLNDICFISTTVPKMLVNIQTQSKAISYEGCLAQMYFFMIFASLDSMLLTVMAYDRFVAICHPLHYTVIMNPRLCGLLLLLCWSISLGQSSLQVLLALRVSFCRETKIPHFFCELAQILKLACSDTMASNIVQYFITGLLGIIPLSAILFSYSRIISSILSISSAAGKYKAFSTCGSHLSVVSLFYGAGLGVYLSFGMVRPSKTSSVCSVMYTVVSPTLNPFIYSLRNKDMKGALRKLLQQSRLLSVR
ncbi:olfactory receptor 7D4-like [Ochotona curzoniae]|uniref:olfactory receptor 7D4-like n=1 Tax=Ochotona curzoniae TaxID=130825 RepID=UPI001B349080|nr:olfactory receptor 7D4-like [Ochotona curzoniae]